MRFIYTYLIAAVLVLFGRMDSLRGQSNDTLPVVTISHVRGVTGVNQLTLFDSAQKMRSAGLSMAEMISQSGQAYIKQYGPGNISVANLRGGSSYHTSLLWNGLNLSNPMLGNTDLSLFPALFTDISEIQYGSQSSLWGSGNVAGSFQNENTASFRPQLYVLAGTEYNTLGSLTGYTKVQGGNKRAFGSFRAFAQGAENNYEYYNPYTQTEEKLEHAQTRQFAVFGEGAYKINSKNMIHAISFVNRSNRMIAPLLTENNSYATQLDENLRGLIYWKRALHHGVLHVRAAAIGDRIVYTDSSRNIGETSQSLVLPIEAEWKTFLKKNHSFILYSGYRQVVANYDWLAENIIQHNFSSLAKWMWITNNKNISGNVLARHENSMGKNPLTFSTEVNYHPSYEFKMNLRAATLYRLPTLNDLYWEPGGNKNLLPEQGVSVDGGILYRPGAKLHRVRTGYELEGRAFYRNVSNWIQWVPGNQYWSPQNIDHVESYGSEASVKLFLVAKETMVSLQINTLYAVSSPINGSNKGLQLIYSPMYSGNAQLEIRNEFMWFSYAHFYTGYRYTSSDNYQYLEPYYYAQTEAGGNIRLNKTVISISTGVRNLFDTDYQTIANRPMPGRWFFVRLQFHLIYKK